MTTTLVKDPITGAFVSNSDPSGTGRTMVDLNGGVITPSTKVGASTDPYSLFNKNLAQMLVQIRAAQSSGRQNMSGARDFLTSESVAPGGPQAFDPSIGSDSQVRGQQSLKAGFDPAITSVNTQMENTDKALNNLGGDIGTLETAYAPREVGVGSSLITPGGETVTPGFNPTINPETGVPYGYVDFSGKANNVGPYSTDSRYQSEVDSFATAVAKAVPAPSADAYDAYVAGHAKSSPIRGQMVMSASQKYNIDPNYLMAVLGHETDYGTAGEAPKNNNPGGVKFANQSGAVRGSAAPDGGDYARFASWQQGVNAAAYEISKRVTDKNPSSTALQSNVGGQFSSDAGTRVQQLPQGLQQYAQAGPKGVAYFDDEKVPDAVKTTLKTLGARAGIPYLDSTDVHNLKAIGQVYENVTKMKGEVDSVLNHGFFGGLKDIAKTKINAFTHQNAFPELAKFNSYRDVAIRAVQALAGGSGSGLRLNTGEIMASAGTLPDSNQSIETANSAMTGLLSLLDTNMATSFPYLAGKQPGLNGGDQTGGRIKVKIGNKTGTIDAAEFDPGTMTKL